MNTQPNKPHVAIIGGGISGLSVAWYLQKAGLPYTIIEKAERWGGKIRTDVIDDFIVEGGPDSFITQKPWALQLARELGMDDDLLNTNDAQRKVFVLNKGKATPLPDGVMLIVPTKFMPFAVSPLISPLGKLRMGLEMFIPAKRDGEDETLAQFIRRRLGSEALDKIAEPLMAGIYNAEAEKQSLLATFPRFRKLEEDYGSITRGMLAAKRKRAQAAQAPTPNGKPKTAMFVSFRNGTETLVDKLVAALDGDMLIETGVDKLEQLDSGYQLHLSTGDTLSADMVILTTPAYVAASLVEPLSPTAAEELKQIRYVSTGTMSVAFRRDEIQHPLNGFGLVIPPSEQRFVNAVTWTSTKFDYRAPDDHVLLRVFFGGSRRPEMMQKSDDEVRKIVLKELEAMMGITATPVMHRIYRWMHANPQYDVGHLQRVDAIEAALPPGMFVTGSAYRGIGMPDCVRQSQELAAKLSEIEGAAQQHEYA